MKKITYTLFVFLFVISCNKKEENQKKIAEQKKHEVDSTNAAITKHNDSILILNKKNKHQDLSGNHRFTMDTDGVSKLTGTTKFVNTGRDEYTISGEATSGKNSIKIEGTGKLISDEFLNFEGEIVQNIAGNGGKYVRKGKKTFQAKGNAQYWRLQDMVNGDGFVDYIDIHFK
ncbi:hypothetical protein [Frigoriflavimonas asaccharolytica]|uniref:Lipoprotein n=1 Tax=Frigoriflavimonas asaccharolytica TaxID=2735899 RepID=A0A8J8K9T7_9FLAO|nr:hypothetical protein [Frigoriflavimonas asaccharolytica]NRS93437.1 hypothetical protein [Frigoriflavimonas asaccharolytica]